MSFHIKAEQERFTWALVENTPAAYVEKWGHGYWIVCCPLCGYLHNLPANLRVDAIGTPFKPNCAIAKQVHRGMYDRWIEKYPQARQFDTVHAILRTPNVIPLDNPQKPITAPQIVKGKTAA